MAEDAGKQTPSSLDEFSKRLDAVRGAEANAEKTRAAGGQASGQAFRLSSELLAGILVGCLLGWGIDRLLGTTPWALVAGIFLGFGAGVLNVARAMKAAQAATTVTEGVVTEVAATKDKDRNAGPIADKDKGGGAATDGP